jgi:two-component system chemotaxis response regulator CheY
LEGRETGSVGRQAIDTDRPSFRIATFGLARRFRRLLEIIVRHARHNPYRFVLTDDRPSPEASYDIALVDMTAQGGAETARTLRNDAAARPVIGVGRRQHHARGSDDVLMRTFSLDVLSVLNRTAEHLVVRESEALGASAFAADRKRAARALVIEPSPSSRSQVMVALRQIGIRADGTGSIAAATAALATHGYALVVTELDLPDGRGMDLIRRLQAMGSDVRPSIIVLSRRCGWVDLGRAAFAGCAGFLGKPTEPATLQATARRALARARRSYEDEAEPPPSGQPRLFGALAALVSPFRWSGQGQAAPSPAGRKRRADGVPT